MALLRVHLTPRSGRNEAISYRNGVLYLRVTAPPVEGAANRALIELISQLLQVRKSSILIKSGAAGREKVLDISLLEPAEMESRLRRCLPNPGKSGT